MKTNQDQHYIEKAKKGDTKAFAFLVDQYKNMVYTLAFRMLKNKEEAEEVAQDVFLKVYNGLSTFKGDSKFSSWLYRITYNRSLDYIKKHTREVKTAPIDAYTERYVRAVEDILVGFEAEDRKNVVKKAMDELSGEDSFIMTLYYFKELPLSEIADITKLTKSVVKVRLFRGRKKLAVLLKNRLEPETIG
ncbi:MAG: sigma-70 family RNA polymerase sigma factor [Cellulophaga sp.]